MHCFPPPAAELTRVGVLNVPDWAEAGKVYAESENAIPFSSLLMVQLFLFNFVGEEQALERVGE